MSVTDAHSVASSVARESVWPPAAVNRSLTDSSKAAGQKYVPGSPTWRLLMNATSRRARAPVSVRGVELEPTRPLSPAPLR